MSEYRKITCPKCQTVIEVKMTAGIAEFLLTDVHDGDMLGGGNCSSTGKRIEIWCSGSLRPVKIDQLVTYN